VSLLSVISGVVHIIEDLLIPHGAFRLTAEKVLSSLLPFPFLLPYRSFFPHAHTYLSSCYDLPRP
jgi:hypothetical protein